ncbi:MAG: SDR family oxidoreductase [bacterium]
MQDTKVIVITGASGGIGAALAKHMGAQGHQIVLAARRERELKEVAGGIGQNALPVRCDVTHRSDVERLKTVALERFGRIDVWVNNVGRGIGRKVLELSDDDLEEMLSVNLKSALYGMQVIIPYFQEQGSGHLINISTFLSRVPFATYRSAYSAAKAALNCLTANLRMDLRASHPGIHISLVMPGTVLTDFAKNALGGTPAIAHGASSVKPQTADEVAAVIADVIENPKPEVYTNPILADIAHRYCEDIAAFEEGLAWEKLTCVELAQVFSIHLKVRDSRVENAERVCPQAFCEI